MLLNWISLGFVAAQERHITAFNSFPSQMIYFDDSTTILTQEASRIWKSTDNGASWSKVETNQEVSSLIKHPNDVNTAIILGKTQHSITTDKGAHWRSFKTPYEVSPAGESISFGSTGQMILRLRKCDGFGCHDDSYYTTNSFKNNDLLLEWANQCSWISGIGKDVKSTKIFCLQWPEDQRHGDTTWKDPNSLQLVSSSDFFKTSVISNLFGGVPVLGITQHWFVSIVKGANGYQFHTSKDGDNIRKSLFIDANGGTNGDHLSIAFSVLQSSNSTLFVDVLTERPGTRQPLPFGTLFASSSDGGYFLPSLEHTNRDLGTGAVDFEHIQSTMYDGVLLANVVDNWEELVNGRVFFKKLASKMSFNNGRTWSNIPAPKTDKDGKELHCETSPCYLHLHSVTTSKNVGAVFAVSSSPGTIIGVGSVGANLKMYDYCDTFMSDDSGLTWRHIQNGPHKFEILDFGSTIVLIPDGNSPTSSISYSKNRGKTWEIYEISIDGMKWIPQFTNIDSNSTSTSMIIAASKERSDGKEYFIHLDFKSVFSRKCDSKQSASNSDLEKWEVKGKNDYCVLGANWSYFRRKADADCFIDSKFSIEPITNSPCKCTDEDYECDIGFRPDRSSQSFKCIPVDKNFNDQPADCKIGSKYKSSSGYKFIAGNLCKGGTDKKAEPVLKECREMPGSAKPPGEPRVQVSTFKAHIVELAELSDGGVAYVLLENGSIHRTFDFGSTWKQIEMPNDIPIERFFIHESKKDRIVLFSRSQIFVIDDGKLGNMPKANEIILPDKFNEFGIPILDFHPIEPDWFTFVGGTCDSQCFSKVYITKNMGKTWSEKPLETWVTKCVWARDIFFEISTIPLDAIYCTGFKYIDNAKRQNNLIGTDRNPIIFKMIRPGENKNSDIIESLVDSNVLDFFVDRNVLLVAIGNPKSPTLLSSIDGKTFNEVKLPPGINFNSRPISLLESSSPGIFLAINMHSESRKETAVLLKSNSDAVYFSSLLDSLNQDSKGLTDFQKYPGLQNTAIINIAKFQSGSKIAQSVITFDDGITFQSLNSPTHDYQGNEVKCSDPQDCRLHIHLGTEASMRKMMYPFGTNNTAGLILGVGNIGNSLSEYDLGNLYLSKDGGKNWMEIFKGPHLWAFANQGGLLVAVSDESDTSELKYTWNYGSSWATFKFTNDPLKIESIVALGGSNRIIITGHSRQIGTKFQSQTLVYSLDFSSLFNRNCDEKDYEAWTKDYCVLGEFQEIYRRRVNSLCIIDSNFKAVKETKKTCKCEQVDFECVAQYFRNQQGKCELIGTDPAKPEKCDKTYKGISGYQKVKTSKCSGGVQLDKEIDKDCGSEPTGPNILKIHSFAFEDLVDDFFYFKGTGRILLTDKSNRLYLSKNEGESWERILKDSCNVIAILEDLNFSDRGFIFCEDSSVMVTSDRGDTFSKLSVTGGLNFVISPKPIVTHELNKDWILWVGTVKCELHDIGCHTTAQVSWDGGKNWNTLVDYAYNCEWGNTKKFQKTKERTIFCSVFDNVTGDQRTESTMHLKRFDDGNRNSVELLKTNAFVIENEYLIATMVIYINQPHSESKDVKIHISLDGSTFATATFDAGFPVKIGYTVLDSPTGNLYFQLIQSTSPGAEIGSLFKSNSNGTVYHKSIDSVNLNRSGYVDFERVNGIVGRIIVNTISNADKISHGEVKKLKTMITTDDGENWTTLQAPKLDSNNEAYYCRSNCHLNLHAYTERHDTRDEYSSVGATGMLIGVGNVGESLTKFTSGDMFLSMDGGITWKEIAKEAHMFEITNHGGIIVMVNDEEETDYFKYSLNGGEEFFEFNLKPYLNGKKFRIQNILTEPSGSTLHVVLIGKLRNGSKSSSVAFHIDFSKTWSRVCEQNDDGVRSDFEEWTLGKSGECYFGAQYFFTRRKANNKCSIGEIYKPLKTRLKPCECTNSDFECDVNFRLENSKCIPANITSAPVAVCENGLLIKPTGYLKKKITQCVGGLQLDKSQNPESCSSSGISTRFFIFVVPLTLTAFYMLYLYRKDGRGISLPVDESVPVWENRTSFQRVMSNIYSGALYGVEICVSVVVSVYDKIRNRFARNEGYAPVSTHYYDPERPTTGSLELEWDEEAEE